MIFPPKIFLLLSQVLLAEVATIIGTSITILPEQYVEELKSVDDSIANNAPSKTLSAITTGKTCHIIRCFDGSSTLT
jgi:hypothetical protein